MLSLIFIISLILAVILFKKTSRNCKYEGLYFTGAILNVALAIILGFLILDIIVYYIDVFNVDKKIDIYIEENKKIESDVSIAVGNYQIYENSTFKEIIDNPTVLAVVCPELKSNELVLKQVDLYIENSQKIKDLKLMKVTKDIYKFLLYLG
ncbi:hypothetical protein CWE04_11470 [Thomasclavelia cocleata]|uniref:Uncharacterized protein n=1 Tax=Thomasclavelia cocleata TaxID=69824 RepID=A0A1I0GCI8_9FIRM|nr:hypothetical protein [Thomasclavelia cocleata]MCR1959854.1 hypothetical protein [Thomasclavelia cocleata]NDO43204.1 hypothetical protein [Thomasclavelia cocleata]PJN79824.1 hypothetical protein CWE04_11470 [Thomasclavelia cocleata]SET68691.1 hypothetical protein SAMN04489758_12830 [Thomasclavelia cocleata]